MRKLSPIPNTFTKTIATREFELSHKNGIEKIILEIGVPVKDVELIDGSCDWRCPVKIIYGSEVMYEQACGYDSFQALELAITQLVKIKLKSIARAKEAKILLYGEIYNIGG